MNGCSVGKRRQSASGSLLALALALAAAFVALGASVVAWAVRFLATSSYWLKTTG